MEKDYTRAIFSVKVILADRDLVEQGAEEILESARVKEVATGQIRLSWQMS